MKSTIKIAICDDEVVDRDDIERMCRAFFEDGGISMEMPDVHVFSFGEEITASGEEYDILFLDIEMPERDGISIKEHFEAAQKQTRIIFTTSHKERVLEAFGKNVVGFLPKPLHKEKNADFGHMNENAKAVFRRSNIGIVFQQHCLVPDLTVYENIMLPMMLDRNKDKVKRSDSMKDTILNLCKQFGLEEHTKKYPSQLSGGQQQRVAILRSIANRPSLLLCDEPTGSLNSAHTEIVMKLLGWLNKKGQTILLVTHDIKVAVRGKRVIYIKDGRIGGELRFSETHGDEIHQKEVLLRREEELRYFLQKKGW